MTCCLSVVLQQIIWCCLRHVWSSKMHLIHGLFSTHHGYVASTTNLSVLSLSPNTSGVIGLQCLTHVTCPFSEVLPGGITVSSKVGPRQHLPEVATFESLLSAWRDIDMEVCFSCEGVLAPPSCPCPHLPALHCKQNFSIQTVACIHNKQYACAQKQ